MATVQSPKRSRSSDSRYFFAKLGTDRDGNQCETGVAESHEAAQSDIFPKETARREFVPLEREDRYIFAGSGCYVGFGERGPRHLLVVPEGVAPTGDCFDPLGHEWMDRETGWRTVARLNAEAMAKDGTRFSDLCVLLEVGNELAPSVLIFGSGPVGELKLERTFAFRVVHPTAAEIAKFGSLKGGDA